MHKKTVPPQVVACLNRSWGSLEKESPVLLFFVVVMHQSIPNAPCPPPPGLTPGNLPFFSYGWQIPGGGGTQAAKCPAVGTKVDGKCPAIRNESNATD